MAKLSDFFTRQQIEVLGFANRVKAVLAINIGGAATVKTTNAFSFTNNGVQLTKAALAAQSIAVTHTMNGKFVGGGYVQPVSTTVYYTLGLDAAGVVSVAQSAYAGQPNLPGAAGTSLVGDGQVSESPVGSTPVGVIKVVTNGATTFTPGTTALDAAGLTVTYFDVEVLPAGLL